MAALGMDVVIAQAGTEDGRLACLLTADELGGQPWQGTVLRLAAPHRV